MFRNVQEKMSAFPFLYLFSLLPAKANRNTCWETLPNKKSNEALLLLYALAVGLFSREELSKVICKFWSMHGSHKAWSFLITSMATLETWLVNILAMQDNFTWCHRRTPCRTFRSWRATGWTRRGSTCLKNVIRALLLLGLLGLRQSAMLVC